MRTTRIEAVGGMYAHHRGWLLGWLGRRLGCHEQAADLLQDTFLRVLRTPEGLLAADEPRAYLTTVARRLLANHYRRLSLEQAWLEVLRSVPEELAPSEEQRWILMETLQEIDAALDTLPRRARHVFLLSQLEGLTYVQIAERTGVNVRTIKRDMALAFERCLRLSV